MKKIGNEIIYQIGDKVEWGYWHSLNRVSRTWRVKKGVIVWITKCATKAKVKFDGNKTCSRVPLSELSPRQSMG